MNMRNIEKSLQTKKRRKNIAPEHYDINYYEYQSQPILEKKMRDELDFILGGISSVKSKKILEIGCGSGKNMRLFDPINTFYGLDYSSDAIKLCHKAGLNNTVLASADAVPVKDGWADVILVFDVIEHLEPFRYRNLLQEIDRILSYSGKLIISTPIRDRIPFVFRRVYNKIVGLEEPYYWSSHINELTLNELLTSFKSIGFKPTKTKIANNSHFISLNAALGYFLGGGITVCLEREL